MSNRKTAEDGIRLNKALADAGVCSRRGADELVFAGVVEVNGQKADSPGIRVVPGRDSVALRGKPVELRGATAQKMEPCWLMLHKPTEVVSTARDPEGRRTVLDFVPTAWSDRRLYPVGRLDFFSEGLLLLTDEGELAHRLMHPRWHLPRVYHVRVRPENAQRLVPDSALEAMRLGMTLAEGEKLAPVDVRILPNLGPDSGPGVLLELTLHQGVNRQVRRMCRDLNLTVLRLVRLRQGPLELGDLPSGSARPLTPGEVAALRQAVGLGAA